MIHNLTCFGPVEWYASIMREKTVMLSVSEPWRKQTVRNRYTIMTANGQQTLTVPVAVDKPLDGGRPTIADAKVSDHGNWRHVHWQALLSAYGMSPFFDYYADEVKPLFEPGITCLADYDLAATRLVLRLLGSDTEAVLCHEPVTCPVESLRPLPATYYQTFQRRHGFMAGMSVLDLLFNMGPEGISILK